MSSIRTYIFCLIIYISLFSVVGYSQQNLLDKRISIEFKNKKMNDAISILNKKLGNVFSYKNNIFGSKLSITIKAEQEPLRNVLEKIFKNTKIIFFQSGDQIILKNSNKEKMIVPDEKSKTMKSYPSFQNKSGTCLAYIAADVSEFTRMASPDIIGNKYTHSKLNEVPLFPFNDPLFENDNLKTEPKINVRGRHNISLSPGFKTNSKTAVSNGVANINTNLGVTGSISYGYMFSDEWQMNFQTGVFVVEANVSGSLVSAKSIIPIIFGMRYFPPFLSISDFGNAYLGGGLGAYVGFSSSISNNLSTISGTETKAGVNLNFGLDFFPLSWLRFGPGLAYHFFGNYSKIIQEEKNFSGAEFCLNLGVVL